MFLAYSNCYVVEEIQSTGTGVLTWREKDPFLVFDQEGMRPLSAISSRQYYDTVG